MTESEVYKRRRRQKTSAQVSQDCRALRLAVCCKKLSWCFTNVPILILASELVWCVYVLLFKQCYLFTLLLLLLFFYCFRRCCHFFSPKDKYFILFYFKPNKWNNAMSTHVTKYRGVSLKREKASEGGWGERRCREVGFTKSTNRQNVNAHLTWNVALCVMELVNHLYHDVTLKSVQCRYDQRGCQSVCPDAFCHIHLLLHPSIPPSVHRSPASSTSLTVYTKGVHNSTKTRESESARCCYCYDYCYWHNWLLSAMVYTESLFS